MKESPATHGGGHRDQPTGALADPPVTRRGPWWAQIEEALCGLLLASVLVVAFAGAVSRYATDSPLSWSEPLARYLLIWLTMLGAAALVKSRGHITVTAVYEVLPRTGRRVLDGVSGVVQIGIGLYLVLYGGRLVADASASTSVPGVDMATVYAIVPVGGALIVLYSLRDLLSALTGAGGTA